MTVVCGEKKDGDNMSYMTVSGLVLSYKYLLCEAPPTLTTLEVRRMDAVAQQELRCSGHRGETLPHFGNEYWARNGAEHPLSLKSWGGAISTVSSDEIDPSECHHFSCNQFITGKHP